MTYIISKFKQPRELLNHILDQPELPAIIQSLDGTILTKLIRHIGLEDSAEIISLATVEQLDSVFDEDLWYSRAPGQEESFDAERFGLWLEIMLEAGSGFAARKVMEFDEDLLVLALCRLVLVVDIDRLAISMSDEWRQPEDYIMDKIMDSTLNQEFGSYIVIARSESGWEAVLALLLELNEIDYDTLIRLLERCCRISCEYIEDSGTLFDLLTAEEMLEADVAAEREARREDKGFISASTASGFLKLASTTSLDRIISSGSEDTITQAYFKRATSKRSSAPKNNYGNQKSGKKRPSSLSLKIADFFQTLRAADVLPVAEQKILDYQADSYEHHLPLARAMRLIDRTSPELYSRRLLELGYLSNILVSGCSFQGRAFRPVEAAEAAFSLCNLGSEHLLLPDEKADTKRKKQIESITAILTKYSLVKLFQAGWKILNDDVLVYSAKGLLDFLDHIKKDITDPRESRDIKRVTQKLLFCISGNGKCEFDDQLYQLNSFFPDDLTIMSLTALLQKYPTMSEAICRDGEHRISPFIFSYVHIQTVHNFLKAIF